MANKGKTAIYVSNIVIPGLVGLVRSAGFKESLGFNLGGALFYSGLDLLSGISDRIKNSKFTRLSKFFGTVGYAGKAVYDGYNLIANQDYEFLIDLSIDIPMAIQLAIDTYESYRGKDLVTDLGF